MKKYIPQNPRLNPRARVIESSESTTIYRTAQRHHDLRRAKVLDGCDSSTHLFDESIGDVPEVFDINVDRLDLADALLRQNGSIKDANKVATGDHTSESTCSIE